MSLEAKQDSVRAVRVSKRPYTSDWAGACAITDQIIATTLYHRLSLTPSLSKRLRSAALL